MASSFSTQDFRKLKNSSRNDRAAIAEDTLVTLKNGQYRVNASTTIRIAEDVEFSMSNTQLYLEGDLEHGKMLVSDKDPTSSECEYSFANCTTLQAAERLAQIFDQARIGVLNFASAKNPGGGFLRGSCAQEESLARSSALYHCLKQPFIHKNFYDYHRRGRTGLYSNRMIYSPKVTVFKDDDGDILKTPYQIGILTAPAPNAGVYKNSIEIREVLETRIKRILTAFEHNRHDILILGAYGCGVFRNDPVEVATVFRNSLNSDRFKNSFQQIVFAVTDESMLSSFQNVFNKKD